MLETEVRCPRGRLFTKVLSEQRPVITEGNLMEFSCRDCRQRHPDRDLVDRVLHRFDLLGQLVETAVVYSDGRSVLT